MTTNKHPTQNIGPGILAFGTSCLRNTVSPISSVDALMAALRKQWDREQGFGVLLDPMDDLTERAARERTFIAPDTAPKEKKLVIWDDVGPMWI